MTFAVPLTGQPLVAQGESMLDPVEALILDLLEWLATRERTYEEALEAWRTSCPRLPVWEDATDRGLIVTELTQGCSLVRITSAGVALLDRCRPASRPPKC